MKFLLIFSLLFTLIACGSNPTINSVKIYENSYCESQVQTINPFYKKNRLVIIPDNSNIFKIKTEYNK